MARRKVLVPRKRRRPGMRVPKASARPRRRATPGIGRRRRGGGAVPAIPAAMPMPDMGGGGAGEPGPMLGT